MDMYGDKAPTGCWMQLQQVQAAHPPTPLARWVGTACQRLVWMRAADKTDGHHVDTLSTFIYKGPVESRQTEEEESVESANALQLKNGAEVGSADRKVVGRDRLI